MAGPRGKKPSIVNTLRLSKQRQRQVLSQLEQQARPAVAAEQRRSPRHPYTGEGGAVLEVHHPGGGVMHYLVRPRNISRQGIGFLHGGYVHPESRCSVILRRCDGRGVMLGGRVARCRHLDGRIHEVGVQFDEPIRPEDFLSGAGGEGDEAAQSIPLPRLSGRVLYIEKNPEAAELLRLPLARLGVNVRVEPDPEKALALAEKARFDLVIIGVLAGGPDGVRLVERLFAAGCDGPVITLVDDPSGAPAPTPGSEDRDERRTETIHRPYDLQQVIQRIARRLKPKDDPRPAPSGG